VIWNTKTREAVKECLSQLKTVTDLIEDKIKNETNLPDYLALLQTSGKNTISGIELYKIIDVSPDRKHVQRFQIVRRLYRCQS
jgi:D-arabinose 1-dehydrogenase-like Zn-dependent alcohol dehydrogenase